MRHSRFGFELNAVGESPPAARYGGIDDRRIIFISMLVAGGLAGLAGAVEIAGIHDRLQDDFAPGIGITAIAVALLARLNPLFIPFAAILFGILSVGSGALQRELGVPFPLLQIIEGIVILGYLILSYLHSRKTSEN
jgi:simple sugar transport system permease protein